MSYCGYFLTLTYEKVPKGGLSKYDVQNFFKRVRNRFGGKFKYYLCGEYGSHTQRPHYHAIILFESEPKPQFFSKSVEFTFEHAWHHGFVSVGTVTPASIGYVTKYLITEQDCPPGMEPPFHLISKCLGKDYIAVMKKWHRAALVDRVYVPAPDGVKMSMPRYYKEKIYTGVERAVIASHAQAEYVAGLPDERFNLSGDNVFVLTKLYKDDVARRLVANVTKSDKF
jgi:hypothetical protein